MIDRNPATPRIWNVRLRLERQKRFPTAASFARSLGIYKSTYNLYEVMRVYPSPEHAAMISSALRVSVEELFPAYMKELSAGLHKERVRYVWQIATEAHDDVSAEDVLTADARLQDEVIDRQQLCEALSMAMRGLSEREREALKLAYGDEKMTLNQIGVALGMKTSSPSNVQRFINTARDKLRNTRRVSRLLAERQP